MSMVLVPVTVIVLAVLVELVRRRPFGLIDFFLAFQLMFTLNYFVAPILIHAVSGATEHGKLTAQVFYLPLMSRRGIDEPSLAAALLWAIVGYMAILAGYFGAGRFLSTRSWWPKPLTESHISTRVLMLTASSLLVLSMAALAVYIRLIEGTQHFYAYYGLEAFFRAPNSLRQNMLPTFGFLKHIAMLAMPACLMFAEAALRREGTESRAAVALATVAFLLTVSVLFHNGGRVELLGFLILFPLAAFMRGRRFRPFLLLVATVVAGFWALFGKFMMYLTESPLAGEGFQSALEDFGHTPVVAAVSLFGELSYPLIVLANTLKVVPDEIGYRLFMDLPLGLFHLLPKVLIGTDWPPTLNLINIAMFGFPIPIDLLSFGFFSLGYLGLALVAVLFGLLLRFLNGWLDPYGGWLVVLFRAAWLTYLPIRIMSADPYASLKSGFQLIVGTVILLALINLSARRSTPHVKS